MNGKTNANSSGGASTGISIPLEPPTNLALSAEDSKISLTWTDPNDKYTETYNELVSQWSYDSLVRKQGSAPTSINDGTLVAKITGKNQYQNIPYVDTGMENDKEWFYSVFAHNQFNTPSDPIYGSEIPTATVVMEYIMGLPALDNSSTGVIDSYPVIDTNGTNLYILNCRNNGTDDLYIKYSQDLVKSTQISTMEPLDEYEHNSLNDVQYASTRVGNNLIITRTPGWLSDRNEFETFYIDNNSVEHSLTVTIYDGVRYPYRISAADINNETGYFLCFAYMDDGSNKFYDMSACRIDSNLLSSSVNSFDNIARAYWSTRTIKSVNNINYCAFYGDFGENSNLVNIYLSNGTTRVVTLLDNDSPSWLSGSICSSHCNDYLLFYASYGFVSTLSESFVVTQLDPYPEDDNIAYLGTQSPNGYPSIGVGIMMIFGDPNGDGGHYHNTYYVDKNLIYRDGSDFIPLTKDEFYGYPNESGETLNAINCIRMGRYMFVPITFVNGYNEINYIEQAKVHVIKNGYESDTQ